MGLLNTRRMYMGHHKPYDAEVEYLEVNTSNVNERAWIDTGYVPNANTKIYTKFVCYDGYADYCGLIGMRFNNKNEGRILVVCPSSLTTANRTGSMGSLSYGPNTYNDKIIHTLEYNLKDKFAKLDDTSYSLKNAVILFTNEPTLSLFRNNGYPADELGFAANGRIYYIKIVENDVVLDMIPVVKNGIGYMYDKVSEKLFGNDGPGNFIIGPDI